MMVEARHLDQLLHPQFKDAKAYAPAVIGSGLAASPGAAVGRVVFSAADAEAWKLRGERVVLVRHETSPEDVGGVLRSSPPLLYRWLRRCFVSTRPRRCCVFLCINMYASERYPLHVRYAFPIPRTTTKQPEYTLRIS